MLTEAVRQAVFAFAGMLTEVIRHAVFAYTGMLTEVEMKNNLRQI